MDTFVGIVLAAVLVLPGFVTQELTVRRRPSARADSQTVTQRALSYAVVIQLIWSWDTWRLAKDLTGGDWKAHYAEVVVWVTVVLVATPVLLGLAINEILIRAETGGQDLKRFHYALGGRDAREAWDYFFQTLDRGAWVLVRLVASTRDAPVMYLGKYGESARHSQSPAAHDVFFDEVWSVDNAGKPIEKIDNLSGIWVSASQIEAMFPLAEDEQAPEPSPQTGPDGPVLSFRRLAVYWLPGHQKTVPVEAGSPTAGGSQYRHREAAPPGFAGDHVPPPESGAPNRGGAALADSD
jgi:hypothetical protein